MTRDSFFWFARLKTELAEALTYRSPWHRELALAWNLLEIHRDLETVRR